MSDQDPRERKLLDLSPRQQTAIAAAATILSAAIILAAVLGLGWVLAAFFGRFSNVFLPLAVGGIAALTFSPYFRLLRTRLKMPPVVALVVVCLSILLPVVGFGFFFGAIAFDQISELVSHAPEWWDKTSTRVKAELPVVRQFFEENPWGQRIQEAARSQQEALLDGLQKFGVGALSAGRGIFRGIGTLVAWAVLPVYFAFFLMAAGGRPKGGDMSAWFPFLKAETREDVVYLITEFINIIVAFFRGQLIIAFLQGLLFAIGFSAVGLRYGFVLGLMLGFLNIIPYLGSIIGLGIGLPLAYFQEGGGPITFGLVILVFTIVQMIEGYVLTPRIMGDRTGLHPVVIIVAVFFWGSALQGILGMILAIPLTAFLVVFWRLAREKYISEWL